MPNNHVTMKVGNTTYRFVVVPQSYSEVDIVDFAPRTVASTPARSELGLYLDVGQESFAHGYGKERMVEAEMYAYSGHLVDTSHGSITLMTSPSPVSPGFEVFERVVKILTFSSYFPLILTDYGLFIMKPSNGTFKRVIGPNSYYRFSDALDNGRYLLICGDARLKVCDLRSVYSELGGGTYFPAPWSGWRTNMWAGGKIVLFDSNKDQERDIVSNTANGLTVSYPFTGPVSSGYAFIYNDTGVSGNPPYYFGKLAIFGGFTWGFESGGNWSTFSKGTCAHYWSQADGEDAEGGGDADLDAVMVGGPRPVTNVQVFNNQLWCFKTDGVWAILDDKKAYYIMNFTNENHWSNFASVCTWNGFLVFPVGNTLYKYKSGLQDITPPDWDWKWPPKGFGRFTGLTPHGKWLYAVGCASGTFPEESTETSRFLSLFRTDGVGWHKLLDMSPASEHTLWGVGTWIVPYDGPSLTPALYYAYVDPTNWAQKLYKMPLQDLSERPGPPFPTTGSHNWYSSYYDLGMVRIKKSYAEVTVEGEFPSGTSALCYVRVDNETSWTSVGTFNASVDTLSIPGSKKGKRIQVKLDLRTNNNSVTPTIKAVVIKQMARPDVLYGATFEVLVEDDLMDPSHAQLGMSASEIRAALKECRASVSPIEFTNIWGETQQAYLASTRFTVQEYESEDGVPHVQSTARVTVVNVK